MLPRPRGRRFASALRYAIVTGGLPQTPGPSRIDELPGYLGGIVAEVDLSDRFSIEANGLYRPFRADEVFQHEMFGETRFEFTALTWQFPVLAELPRLVHVLNG